MIAIDELKVAKFKTFLGSKVFLFPNSRVRLPFFRPDEPVPWGKVLRSLIGQDLSRISLPVILNEPQSMLQRNAEGLCSNHEIYEKASQIENSIKRMCFMVGGMCGALNLAKTRKRKDFNPMLGETFELVTE
jgi:hypothetical protein